MPWLFFLHLIMSEVHFVNCTPLAEETLAKIARVSNPQNENNNKTAPQLIRYMWDHAHYSPFEMADMTLEILTTRAISPQILRHGKGFSFQEFSQRYSNINKIGRIETPQLRAQDPKNHSEAGSFISNYALIHPHRLSIASWQKQQRTSSLNSSPSFLRQWVGSQLNYWSKKSCQRMGLLLVQTPKLSVSNN